MPRNKVFEYPGKPIKLGEKGPIIKWLQEQLKKRGSSIQLTDKFGIGMLSAVKSFQSKNKLKVTGVIDKKTWDKLVAPMEKKAKK